MLINKKVSLSNNFANLMKVDNLIFHLITLGYPKADLLNKTASFYKGSYFILKIMRKYQIILLSFLYVKKILMVTI